MFAVVSDDGRAGRAGAPDAGAAVVVAAVVETAGAVAATGVDIVCTGAGAVARVREGGGGGMVADG